MTLLPRLDESEERLSERYLVVSKFMRIMRSLLACCSFIWVNSSPIDAKVSVTSFMVRNCW